LLPISTMHLIKQNILEFLEPDWAVEIMNDDRQLKFFNFKTGDTVQKHPRESELKSLVKRMR